jgi:hypothetical protein
MCKTATKHGPEGIGQLFHPVCVFAMYTGVYKRAEVIVESKRHICAIFYYSLIPRQHAISSANTYRVNYHPTAPMDTPRHVIPPHRCPRRRRTR